MKDDTKLVAAGRDSDRYCGVVNPPVFRASTILYPNVEAFEAQRFVTADGEGIAFDYRGRHRDVLDAVTAADVVWACRLLARISNQQWVDVFRAAAYPEAISARYRAHIAAKIAEGLTLAAPAPVEP